MIPLDLKFLALIASVCLFAIFAQLNLLMIVGSPMPMPGYTGAAGTGAYRPPGSNPTPGYPPYPPAYSGAGQPSHVPPTQTSYPGYPQGFAPFPQTTQTTTQQTGKA